MKNVYEKVADRILPKFSEVCKRGKCKHPICRCGHCQRNYHTGKVGECTKMTNDLFVCGCNKFQSK